MGKTWILKEFGRRYYENIAYFNFDEHEEYRQFFETTKDAGRILQNLNLAGGQKIQPKDTLIIFDEIQDCPAVINSLKYFCENAPEYHVACAGSLLGIALSKPSSFPVGKVDFLGINPMTFTEFLIANGDENLARYTESVDTIAPIPDAFFNPLYEKLKMYFITGGMPEPVLMWTEDRDTEAMQTALINIISAYERDFSKHPSLSEFPKISMIWKSVPSQLARENKKFLYKAVKNGARAREYEDALQWLADAELVSKIYRSSAPGLPISAYDDLSAFKIYLVDVGLLRRLSQLAPTAFGEGNRLFAEFKGALSENYVLQALKNQFEVTPRYWSQVNPPYEVDFLIQLENDIFPIEVKAETNTKSKSLKKYKEKFPLETKLRVRFSLSNLRLDGDLLNIPLFMADWAGRLIGIGMSRQDLITKLENIGGQIMSMSKRRDCLYISRIAADKREQMTVGHLRKSAEHAEILGLKFHMPSLARTSAFFHDMGKFSTAFVEYLRRSCKSKSDDQDKPRRGSVIHSTQGAKYIYESFADKDSATAAEIVAICIAGHHGGLMDGISAQGDLPLRDRLIADNDALYYDEVTTAFHNESVLSEDINVLMSGCRDEISSFIKICKTEKLNCAFMIHLLVKSIFSCLVDADRYNAYCFEANITPETALPSQQWEEYARRLEVYLSGFAVDSEISKIRHDIADKCLGAATFPKGIYRLDVPTGGGKTLSSLRFALNHAIEHRMERVIYVIPYLSVLEQTAKEIKKALLCNDNENFILEHHSNLIPSDDEQEAQARRLLTDRWSQPIVVTTMVQFLESVYSYKSGDLRKFHSMANAVIIFDEVQSLPVKCLHLFNDALNYLRTFSGCTALLCTATQPLLDKVERPIRLSSPAALITGTNNVFAGLKRTRIVNSTVKGGYSYEALRDFVLKKLDDADNCLVILNTKKDVAGLYKMVKSYMTENSECDIKLIYLSTLMCPAHRLEVIDSMQEFDGGKKKLEKGRILCISTQLIEAGVDISFGCVIRALAGLDSIAQAAGRCNRNGEDPNGREVYIVNLTAEDLSKLPDIKCGSSITAQILEESVDDLLSRDTMERYYREYFYKLRNEMEYPIGNNVTLYDLLSNNKKGFGAYENSGGKTPPKLRQAFQTAGENFCVIEQGTASVLVPYKRGEELAEEYKSAALRDKSQMLREMGRYSVSLYPNQMRKLKKEPALNLIDDGVFALNHDYYDSELGVVFERDMEFLEG
ncbi:hypothetical protein FACS1894187_14670 [Synergistales bacterium]|nr:hypothetical protein FACS1894187_14670 [Synergistales bacterium]